MTKCKSFKPSVNKKSKILILGSMPGVKSLAEQQYYAHPQNRFWKVMSELCNCDLISIGYNERLKKLLENGVALWDTIGSCERKGSLDSDIKKEKPNNIPQLLKKYPNIKRIYLNGNKSYSALKKYFPEILADEHYNIYRLPSTSPANAGYGMKELMNEWKNIIDYEMCP